MIKKWQIEKSEVFKVKQMKIFVEKISSITGPQRIESYYRVEFRDICNIVPITSNHEVVLVKQYRHGLGVITLEVPGGIVRKNGDPKEEALRELIEETGFSGPNIHLIGRYEVNPALFNSYIWTYLLLDAKQVQNPTPDENEEIEVVLLSVPEVSSLISQGKFQQIYSLNAILNSLKSDYYLKWKLKSNSIRDVD